MMAATAPGVGSLVVLVALAGCTGPSAEPLDPSVPVSSVTMPEPPRERVRAARSDAAPGSALDVLLAVAHQNGTFGCPADEPPRPAAGKWVAKYPLGGFVPLRLAGSARAAFPPLRGKPVLIRGHVLSEAPEKPEAPATVQGCSPMLQARSDWVFTADGTRIMRAASRPVAGFAATFLRPLDELAVQRIGDHLRVTFDNPLKRAFPGPWELRMHYEGCYGKPGSTVRERIFPRGLALGKQAMARFPTLLTEARRPAGRRRHRAFSIQLVVTPPREARPRVLVDLDARLEAFGVTVACPAR